MSENWSNISAAEADEIDRVAIERSSMWRKEELRLGPGQARIKQLESDGKEEVDRIVNHCKSLMSGSNYQI